MRELALPHISCTVACTRDRHTLHVENLALVSESRRVNLPFNWLQHWGERVGGLALPHLGSTAELVLHVDVLDEAARVGECGRSGLIICLPCDDMGKGKMAPTPSHLPSIAGKRTVPKVIRVGKLVLSLTR